ncbi:hypothetical protein SAMN05216299_12150 [Nitrosospira sp. Nsp14]|nr:hypothetical protein SAMN05216299_12150 [Nitrosospira sp. Nsp14]
MKSEIIRFPHGDNYCLFSWPCSYIGSQRGGFQLRFRLDYYVWMDLSIHTDHF